MGADADTVPAMAALIGFKACLAYALYGNLEQVARGNTRPRLFQLGQLPRAQSIIALLLLRVGSPITAVRAVSAQ